MSAQRKEAADGRSLALLCALALLLAACGGDGADPPAGDATPPQTVEPTTPEPTATTPAPTPGPTLGASCTNPQDGYGLDYPQDWHVNDPGNPTEPCRVFHPEPFDLEPGTEIDPALAIVADLEPVPMERMAQGDPDVEVLRREEVTVAGHEALVLETRATEDAPLLEPGTRTYLYLVRVGTEHTFVLRATDRGEPAYETKIEVLRAMVATVRFLAGPPSPAATPT